MCGRPRIRFAAMISVIVSLLLTQRGSARSHAALQLEVLGLRHQLQVLHRASGDRQPRHRRGRVESAQPVAESLRGARDRLHSPRVSGPRDHPQPPASPPHPSRVSRLLPSEPHASRPEQRRPGRQAGVCRFRPDPRLAGGRWLASPLRSSGRVSGRRDARRVVVAPGVSCGCSHVPPAKSDRVRVENALCQSIRVNANGANDVRTVFWRTTL